jgi:LysR family glycine cleavage system transcriptional activator
MRTRRALPPLNALRAFEAAARHLSFTRSARELHVTQAAVSHQVKALEQFLGCKLFERRTRALGLTDEGRALLPVASGAFASLLEATERIQSGELRRHLTVSVLPSFAARWLVPRLRRFRRAHPEIELHLQPSTALADLGRGEADIAIRWGRGRYTGLAVQRLMGDESFPVCSPQLLRGPKRLRKPSDLGRHILLHDDNDDDWLEWLAAAGIADARATRGMFFADASLMLQAAADGLGVALGRRVLVSGDLRTGRLVRPFAVSVPAKLAYFLVCQPVRLVEPKIEAFRSWVIAETASDRRSQAGGPLDARERG